MILTIILINLTLFSFLVENFGIIFNRANIILMTKYIRNIINRIIFNYYYYKFMLPFEINKFIFRIYLLYLILILISYTILTVILILSYIKFSRELFEAQIYLQIAQDLDLLRCSYTNIITKYEGDTPAPFEVDYTHPMVLRKNVASDLSIVQLTSADKNGVIKNIYYIEGDEDYDDLEYLREKALNKAKVAKAVVEERTVAKVEEAVFAEQTVAKQDKTVEEEQMQLIEYFDKAIEEIRMKEEMDKAVVEEQTVAKVEEAVVEDIDENMVEDNDEDIAEDNAENFDFPYGGNMEKMIIETLKNVHHNKFDTSLYTEKFPLHRIDLDINLNRIFGFISNYDNLSNYSYYIESENGLIPYYYIFSLVIPPKGGFPENDFLPYISTGLYDRRLTTDDPIITGQLLLPGSKDPFQFITNLIPVAKLKDRETLLLLFYKTITIPNMKGVPTEIDIVSTQRIIQATVRVALAKEIQILENIYK